MFKNKSTELTFYTTGNRQIKELFSPQESMKLLPDWFKTINKNEKYPTLKSCPGFVDLFKKSISIPLWNDIRITYQDSIINIEIPGTPSDIVHHFVTQHPPMQWGAGFKNSIHLKLMSPWHIICNNTTPFMMQDAVWHKEHMEEFSVLPGTLDFKYQHSSHINIMIPRSKIKKTTTLKAGTVIAYLTPMIDTNVDIKTKLVTDEEWRGMQHYVFSFSGVYHAAKKIGEKLIK